MAAVNICESTIKRDIAFDCDKLSVRGLEADGVIINRSDIDFAATVFDETQKNIIKTLVLKSGKKGYQVAQLGSTPFTGTQTTLNVGKYRNTWTHQIPLAVLANDPDVCNDVIDGLANGQFVVILRNKQKANKGEYQVYGYAQGLTASEGTNEKYSEDTDGGWLITLQEVSTPKCALFYYNTDDTTTAKQFASLTTAASSS